MYFDLDTLDGAGRNKLLHATIIPRPIAWVTSLGEHGAVNVAPFSFFNLMSGDPPLLCLCIGARNGKPKDTAANIAARGEFVVNLVSRPLARRMNVTAIDFDAAVDESLEAQLALAPSRQVAVPRLADSPASFECRTRQLIDIDARRTLVLADIAGMHVMDAAVSDSARLYIDPAPMQLIARLHNPGWYCGIGEAFQMPTPTPERWRQMQAAGEAHDYLAGVPGQQSQS